jgi:hypothetical protein
VPAFAPVFAPRPEPAALRVLPTPFAEAPVAPFSLIEAPLPFFAAAGFAVADLDAGLGADFVVALVAAAASARPPAAGACLGALRFGVSSAEFVI